MLKLSITRYYSFKKIMHSKTFLIETTDRFDNKNKFIDFAFKDCKFMLDKF